MQKQVGIGKQDFAALRESQCFYIDKTDFIRQWWNYRDDVTLITRPRRFGKTLNMSMLNCFFSNKYADRGDLFEGIDIWKDSGYRQIQGTYPVLYLSFASVKADNVSDAKKQVKSRIVSLYQDFEYLLENEKLMESEKMAYRHILTEMAEMDDVTACDSLNYLCRYLEHAYGKKVIILLDEYDTPMQEANVYGYWEEMTSFLRNLFNATFKTNKYCIDGLPNRKLWRSAMNKIGTKIIDTERCILRRIVPDDYQMMYENWAKYEEVCRYFPFNPVTDMEIYKEKVHKWADNYESDTYFHWVIEWKENHDLIGTINLGNVEESCFMSDTCYMLSPQYWGQGIMTEVLQAVLKYAFDEIELNRVQAEVFDGNVASVHVLTKCGMRFEGIARQKYYKKDTFIDTAQYAVLKSDFKE